MHFEGKALPWLQLLERSNQVLNWVARSTALLVQFGPSQFENPRAELLKLTQHSSFDEYYEAFMDLANRSYGLDDTLLIDCFLWGLKPELKKKVISRCPHSLVHAVSLAKLFEDKFQPLIILNRTLSLNFNPRPLIQFPQKSYNPTPQSPKFNPPIYKTSTLNTNQNTSNTPLLPSPPKPSNLKKLTPADIQFRRDKGICFTCDEKYSPIHRCTNKHYYLIQCEDQQDEEQDAVSVQEEAAAIVSPNDDQSHHLSYHAMNGTHERGTIRFTGSINGTEIQILVDGGSSDNFIQPRLAKFLQLPIEPTPRLKVIVGNGDLLECEGVVKQIPVHIQGHSLSISAYVLPIAAAELVLGTQWLATLDTHLVNYNKRFIKFFVNDRMYTLQGDTQICQAKLNSII